MVEMAADLDGAMGIRATVIGTLQRHAPEGITPLGTAVVLADGTAIYLAEGPPPVGWDWLLGTRVRIQGRVWHTALEGWPAPRLTEAEAPMPADVGMPMLGVSGP